MPVLKRTMKQQQAEYRQTVWEKARDLAPLPTLFAERLRSLSSKLYPYRFHMKPTETHCASLHKWILMFEEGRQRNNAKEKLLQLKEPLGIHPEFLLALDGLDLDDASNALQEEILEAFPSVLPKERVSTVGMFVASLFELREETGVHDLSRCGDIGLAAAVDFCIPWKGISRKYNLRIWLLERTGFRHSSRLAEQLQFAWQCEKELPHKDRKRLSLPVAVWLRLRWLLGQSPLAASAAMSATDIADAFADKDKAYEGVSIARLFTVMMNLLERHGREDVLAMLRQRLHPQVTGVSCFDWFSSQSQWHADVATRICDIILTSLCRTHFVDKWTTLWQNHVGRICLFLCEYVPERYAQEIHQAKASNAVKWLLDTCTFAQAEVVCQEYARRQEVRNDKVKSQNGGHHAQQQAYWIVNFFKVGVATLQGDASELFRLQATRMLRGVPNKRVSAEGTARRTFTHEEVDAMLQASERDTRHTLLLRLLREVGLRAGCLANLKYGMLVDDCHTPRHVCRVAEKARSWRSFVSSTALKQAIKSHAEMMRQVVAVNSDTYMFHTPTDPQKPCSTQTIEYMVKRVAASAGVVDVHVHPHAFRHTIVGELIDAGNSMDIVSKYMGHANVNTTAQNYWVPTITELHEKLQNPFTGQLQQQQETEEELKRDREHLRTKLDTVLRLLQHQNVVFRTAASQGATADEALCQFQTSAPDAEEILRMILESSGTSQTCSASVQRTAVVPSLAPISECASD